MVPRGFLFPILGKSPFSKFRLIAYVSINSAKTKCDFLRFCAIFGAKIGPKSPQARHDGVPKGILAYFWGEILGKSFFSLFGLITCISTRYEKNKCDFGAILVRFLRKNGVRCLRNTQNWQITSDFSHQKSQKSQFFAAFSHP